jgi:hypothetical protein
LCLFSKDKHVNFTQEEVKALRKLQQTLSFLLNRYKPEHVIKKMHYFAKTAGFFPGAAVYTPSVKRKLNDYSHFIKRTWLSGEKVVQILEQIIKDYSQHKKKLYLRKNSDIHKNIEG